MADFLGLQLSTELVTAAYSLMILIGGLLLTRVMAKIGYRITGKESMGSVFVKALQYLLVILVIFISVYYWDIETTEVDLVNPLFSGLERSAPTILSAILILVLGVMVVNLFMELLKVFISGIRLRSYLHDIGVHESLLRIPLILFRIILYLIVAQAVIDQLGFMSGAELQPVVPIIIAVFSLLVAALAFISFKDPVRNWVAGFYLKSSQFLKMGQRVFIDKADGEVVGFSAFSTILDTGKGYFIAVPHSDFLENRVRIRKSRFELKTLESMRRHYIAQEKSYCVPAVLNIILTLFGYPIKGGQKAVAKEAKTKVPGGTKPKDAMQAVKKLTEGDVRGLMVPYKDIINLRDEVKAWLSEGALVVMNFYKAVLFPGVKKKQKHAVLCVGIEGDELVIIDPNPDTGGVYMVHYKDMERAMGPFDGEERGYIAYAPRGTKAYWRIKNKLYYSDPIYYERLSKGIERKLKQVFRQSKRVKDVFPDYLREFMEEYKSAKTEKIERLWEP